MQKHRRFFNIVKIAPRFTLKYLGAILLVFVAYAAINIVMTRLMFLQMFSPLTIIDGDMISTLKGVVEGFVQFQLYLTLGYLFISTITFFFFIQRISGAIYAINNYLKSANSGNPVAQPLTLRKRDEFQETAQAINDLVKKIQA